jgi:hypothetical protein
MRFRVVTTIALLTLATACSDQLTEVGPDRNPTTAAGTIAFATAESGDGLSITTDKDDYQPGDTVRFTGAGWPTNDVLDIQLDDEPATHPPHTWTIQVGDAGTFRDSTYVVDVGDLGVTFTLKATSQATGRSLTVQFTDGNLQTVSLAAPTSVSVTPGSSAQYTVNATFGGNTNPCTVTLSVTTPLPAGAVATFVNAANPGENDNPVSTTNANFSRTLTITTTAATPPNTYPFTVQAARGSNCQGSGNPTTNGTLIVQVAAATTTTLSATPASPQQFGASVTFTARVKRTSDNSDVTPGTLRLYDGGASCSDLTGATQIGADLTLNASGQAQISTSALTVSPPTHTIRACYLGVTGTFQASEASLSYTIDPAQAGTALAVDPASGTFGGTANLSAKLMAGATPVQGKSIAFTLNGNAACGVSGKPACPTTDASGMAQLTSASLSGINAGTYTNGVGASFAGDATHAAASGSASLTVAKADQTITFSAVGPFTFGDAPFTVTATAASGLAVGFTSQTQSKCTIAGSSVTIVQAGTCTIRASQGGNPNYNPAPDVDQNITISRADQTITFGVLTNKTYGDQPFAVSATASSGLTVTFDLGNGSAGCSISGNTVTITGASGTGQSCIIVAQQAGNVNYNPAPDVPRSFTIAKAPTTAALATSKSQTVFGEDVTFTATVTSGPSGLSGTVTFKDGSSTLGTASLTCSSPCTAELTTDALTTGSHNDITAVYGGNPNFESSTSAALTQVVNPAPTTTTIASSFTATYGDAGVAFAANVTADPPSGAILNEGSVQFTVKQGATEVGNVSSVVSNGSANATFPLPGVNAGTYTVEADYQPGTNFVASSAQTPATLTVDRAPTTTTITSLSNGPYYVNGPVTVNFSVVPTNSGQYASQPTGSVQVTNSSTPPCSAALPVTSCSFTPTGVGSHNLTATYPGDGNFLASYSAPPTSLLVVYKFLGFFAPVDRPNTLNLSKAGQAIPLKWRLLDANNQPITNLTIANITVGSLSCGSTSTADLIEEYAPGSSGLQNQGDGYYQFNWKTPTNYATLCKNIGLDFGNNYVERALALFTFKK